MTHVGLCVSDLDRSLRFYTDGLGFQAADGFDIDDGLASVRQAYTAEEARQFAAEALPGARVECVVRCEACDERLTVEFMLAELVASLRGSPSLFGARARLEPGTRRRDQDPAPCVHCRC